MLKKVPKITLWVKRGKGEAKAMVFSQSRTVRDVVGPDVVVVLHGQRRLALDKTLGELDLHNDDILEVF